MGDETRKKVASFEHSPLIRTAAWLANKGGWMPVLQFRRRADRLEVVGSNGYVMIIGEIDATFSEWEDGECVLFSDRGPILSLSNALKHALSGGDGVQVLEIYGDSGLFHITGYFKSVTVRLPHASDEPVKTEAAEEVAATDAEGRSLVSSSNLMVMAKLTRIVGAGCFGWYVEPHGRNKAMALRLMVDQQRNEVLIIAMPLREES